MLIRKLSLDDFQLTDDCYWQALYPWDGVVETPFGSGWTWLKPGQKTKAHQHHEQETYFIAKGRGEMRVNDQAVEMGPGDVIYLPPFNSHVLENTSPDEDLLFLSVYWEDMAVLADLRQRNAEVRSRRAGTSTEVAGGEAEASEGLPTDGGGPVLLQVALTPPSKAASERSRHQAAGPCLAGDVCRRYLKSRGLTLAAGSSPGGAACSLGLGLLASPPVEGASRSLEAVLEQLDAAGELVDHDGRRAFPLDRWAESLRRAWLSTTQGPALRAACERRLAEVEAGAGAAIPVDGGSLGPWLTPTGLPKDGRRVVFLDLEDSFRLGILLPALLLAAGREPELPDVYVALEDPGKDSGASVEELLSQAPVDIVRLYLAWTSGGETADSPSLENLRREHLEGRWLPWLRQLGSRLQEEYGGTVPGTGLWTEEHRRFYEELQLRVARLQAAYEPASLDLAAAARLLDELVWSARRFAAAEGVWKDLSGRADERRTAVALELTAARALAMAAAPLMPTFAGDLACALGEPSPLAWEPIPAWVPGGIRLEPFDLDLA